MGDSHSRHGIGIPPNPLMEWETCAIVIKFVNKGIFQNELACFCFCHGMGIPPNPIMEWETCAIVIRFVNMGIFFKNKFL